MYEEGSGVSRNYDRAASWYRRAAKQEHGPAERALGNLYNEGRGVKRDSGKAAKWLGRASSRGLAVSQVEYPSEADEPPTAPSREPAPEDSQIAYPELRPLSLLAEEGDVPSQYRLARMYSTGEGAPQSLKEAAKWYREAAEHGHEMAAYKLAFLYLRGHGVPGKDYVQAHKWFAVSAELGVGDAAAWREKIGKKMSGGELVESESLLTEWKSKERGP
jgi:TPR repeat protein